MEPTLYSVGHGARPAEELMDILRSAVIEGLVDIRSFPGSRRHPQFGKDALADTLSSSHIEYVWRPDLGGFRKPRADSPHSALRHPAFRGYADHMDSDEFRAGLEWLIEAGRQKPTAFMCAESPWWRCHRRLLADALVARGCTVMHLMAGGRREEHRLHPVARIEDHRIIYDRPEPEQQALLG
jgi:uncharacterized protein (DUF488 family)